MIRNFIVPGISITNGIIISDFCDLLPLNDSQKAKKLEALIHIKLDMQMARDLFENIIRLEDVDLNYILKYSLWFTASTLYCRCFNEGRGRKIKLNDSMLFKLNAEHQSTHSTIKKQRNKYMAHADSNIYEKFAVFGVPDFDHKRIIGISNVFIRTIVPNAEEIKRYIELTEALILLIASEEDDVRELLILELEDKIIIDDELITSTNPITSDFKAQFYFEAARLECADNNYLIGLDLMTKAIENRPDIWEFYYNRSLIYKNLGDFIHSDEDLANSIRIKGDDPDTSKSKMPDNL